MYNTLCIICNNNFFARLKTQKTCNKVCRQKNILKNKSLRLLKKKGFLTSSINCPTCGTFIDKPKAHQKYCSKQCTQRGKSIVNSKCKICESSFFTYSKRINTCKKECKRILQSKIKYESKYTPSKESIEKGLKTLYHNIKIKKTKRYKTGSYTSKKMKLDFIYRSSWEYNFFNCLDNDPFIVEYFSEPFSIEYIYRNKKRYYFPDVLTITTSGIKTLIEIKPNKLLSKPKNIAKINAARNFCIEKNIQFEIWTEKNNPYLTEKALNDWRKSLCQ